MGGGGRGGWKEAHVSHAHAAYTCAGHTQTHTPATVGAGGGTEGGRGGASQTGPPLKGTDARALPTYVHHVDHAFAGGGDAPQEHRLVAADVQVGQPRGRVPANHQRHVGCQHHCTRVHTRPEGRGRVGVGRGGAAKDGNSRASMSRLAWPPRPPLPAAQRELPSRNKRKAADAAGGGGQEGGGVVVVGWLGGAGDARSASSVQYVHGEDTAHSGTSTNGFLGSAAMPRRRLGTPWFPQLPAAVGDSCGAAGSRRRLGLATSSHMPAWDMEMGAELLLASTGGWSRCAVRSRLLASGQGWGRRGGGEGRQLATTIAGNPAQDRLQGQRDGISKSR